MTSIDRSTLYRLFESLDKGMSSEQTLCVIGAAAVLGSGHGQRQTQDIDVWRPASTINDRDLASATRSAGLGLNPDELVADGVYAYLVEARRIEFDDVRHAIAKLPKKAARETAMENLVFLTMMADDATESQRDDKGRGR